MHSPDDAIERLFRSCYADLVRFAVRRCEPDRAEDVAAEGFIVACRRREDLPVELGDARAWLFGIARRILLAEQRGYARGRALRIRLESEPREVATQHEDGTLALIDLRSAWERLTSLHQEAIALTALDGLSGPEAARVLGVSPVAFRLRLMRARRALAAHLDSPAASDRARPPRPCLTEGAP